MEEIRTPIQQPVTAQPVVAGAQPPVANKKKSKKKLVGLIIGLSLATLVLAAAVVAFIVTRPAFIAKKFVECDYRGNYIADDLFLPYYIENYYISLWGHDDEADLLKSLEDVEGIHCSTWEEYCKFRMQDFKYDMMDDFGRYKLSFDVRSQRDMSANMAQEKIPGDQLDALHYAGFNWDNVHRVKAVTVHISVNGTFDNDYDDVTVYLMPYGFTWNVIDYVYE